jgi:hypothetical protein
LLAHGVCFLRLQTLLSRISACWEGMPKTRNRYLAVSAGPGLDTLFRSSCPRPRRHGGESGRANVERRCSAGAATGTVRPGRRRDRPFARLGEKRGSAGLSMGRARALDTMAEGRGCRRAERRGGQEGRRAARSLCLSRSVCRLLRAVLCAGAGEQCNGCRRRERRVESGRGNVRRRSTGFDPYPRLRMDPRQSRQIKSEQRPSAAIKKKKLPAVPRGRERAEEEQQRREQQQPARAAVGRALQQQQLSHSHARTHPPQRPFLESMAVVLDVKRVGWVAPSARYRLTRRHKKSSRR